jgi:hypothetical protein
MSLEADLKYDHAWLLEHRDFMDRSVLEGYDAIIDGLESEASVAKELETLVKQAFALLRHEWEPEEADRVKFLKKLERAIP